MQVAYLNQVRHLIVIDNRSTDNTVSAAEHTLLRHQQRLDDNGILAEILVNDENYSLGGSHKVGFRYCVEKNTGSAIVLHGDDQADPNDFNDQFATGLPSDVDAILGSRFMKGSKLIGYTLFRQAGNAIFNLLLRVFGFGDLRDMGSGLNFYRLDRLPSETWANAADNLTFHLYFLLSMSLAKANLKFVPISWREEDQKSNARLFSQSVELLKVILLARCIGTRMTSRNYGLKAQLSDYTFKKVSWRS
jgi:glycosyltransferase involved in cell wall biosynthesis